jgi:molybdate transport system permease protein
MTVTSPGRHGQPRGFVPLAGVPAVLGLAVLVVPLTALVGRRRGDALGDIRIADGGVGARAVTRDRRARDLVCIVLGIPLALWIARSGPRLAGVLRAVVTVPLVLPPMVGGVALLFLLGRNGWLGQWLAVVGVRLPFTTAAVVIAQTFVALPFLVLAVEGPPCDGHGLRAGGGGARRGALAHPVAYHAAAGGLGLIAGTVLCFARAIGSSARRRCSPAMRRG